MAGRVIAELKLLEVPCSDAPDPADRRAEDNLFAMELMSDHFPRLFREGVIAEFAGYPIEPQPAFLLLAKAIVSLQNEGKRDEARENEVLGLYLRHHGVGYFGNLMAQLREAMPAREQAPGWVVDEETR